MAEHEAGAAAEGNGDRPLRALRNWLRHWRRSRGGESMRDSLEEIIEEREEVAEPIDPQERMLIGNILKLHELNTADVMVQRVDIVALDVDTPFPEAVRLFIEQGHSRIPVYRETLDDVLGFLHVKDILGPLVDARASDGRPVQLAKLVRKVLVVAPSMPLLDLLMQMRLSRIHMAMVVDEFGGIDGLVTIEDVIEEIVGEIEDEHDEAEAGMLTMLDDGLWEADARIELEELAGAVDRRLSSDEDEVDTLGGLMFLLVGHIPAKGECVSHPSGWKLEAVDSDPRRIIRVRLHAPVSETASD